jgi:hypothetical protein
VLGTAPGGFAYQTDQSAAPPPPEAALQIPEQLQQLVAPIALYPDALGENEYAAIETCHALVQASKQPGINTADVDPITQYSRTLINALPQRISSPSNDTGPFHGYYFRIMAAQRNGENSVNGKTGGFIVVAYPAEYRSSGVMTLIVTQNEVVYETDLGPNTTEVVKAMTSWKRTSTWRVAE